MGFKKKYVYVSVTKVGGWKCGYNSIIAFGTEVRMEAVHLRQHGKCAYFF
jgi:hypothetical protein